MVNVARIRLSTTKHSTVIVCDACPSWSEVVLSREAAHRVAADHELRVHGEAYGAGARAANDARYKHRLREA